MIKVDGIWHVGLLHYSGGYGLCLYLNIIRVVRNIKRNILIDNRRLNSEGILRNSCRGIPFIRYHANVSLTCYLPVYLDCYFFYRCIFGSIYNCMTFHVSSGQIRRENTADASDGTKRVDCIGTLFLPSTLSISRDTEPIFELTI